MKLIVLTGLILSLVVFSSCSSLFHPEASEFYQQAKGATGKETAVNLISLMEKNLQQAKSEVGESSGLHMLHDQFHALRHSFCDFTESQSATTTFEQAYTLNKELKTIFHRLWKFKQDSSLRAIHLDLFSDRLDELKHVLQSMSP